MVNTAEMGGRHPGEKPSNFSVTCSLLSRYLKEKGGFGELSLGMAAAVARPPVDGRVWGSWDDDQLSSWVSLPFLVFNLEFLLSWVVVKPETLRTMNLLPGVEAPEADEHPAASQDGASNRKTSSALSMELFPQSAGFVPVHMDKKPDLNRARTIRLKISSFVCREPRAVAAQMTIFYGGKVVVFDNFPAEKARELMTMAGKGCPDPAQVFRVEKASAAPVVLPQRPSCPPPAQHASAAATILTSTSESKSGATAAAAPAAVTQEEQQKEAQPASSDLPIARRVSLHRFLEKRKDRISSKAPYQLNAPAVGCASSSASPTKPEEARRQWLGLGPQTSKPEDLKR
ncbi:hypothetical protein Taro_025405 [Colocasia esculenta]|uniref:Protein TIFY n=1 Tax=Colocasia esculenta TaxID=4460 RepID=A0A843VKE9_COLES|nr:hypothetical protein [Colocasia esculenta]